ncbi:MAG: Fic family protein [Mangrovibacterium sp.]
MPKNPRIFLPEFQEVDKKLSAVKKLARYDPLISLIRERFQVKITNHLTSLKARTNITDSAKVFSREERKQYYLGIGKEKAVVRLLNDMAGQQLSISNILLLGEILLGATSFRTTTKYITNVNGERQKTPPAGTIPQKMERLVNWYNSAGATGKKHPLEIASVLHHRLTAIHPFKDWNGRIARLLLNLALMKHGYLPVVIGADERLDYYACLEEADKENLRPLIRFIARKEIETIADFVSGPDYLSIQAKYELEQKLDHIGQGEKCIVLTEDSVTNNLLALLLKSSGFKPEETNIISYEGCSKLASANLFSIFVRQKMPWVRILVHRDRDYLTDSEVEYQKQSFRRIDTHLFVTKGTDIESYFINSRHVHHCYPSISESRAMQLIRDAMEEVFPKSVDYLWKKEFGQHRTEDRSHLGWAVEELVRKDLSRFTHGKTALRVLTAQIQDEIKGKASLEKASPFLHVEELSKIAHDIWKK